MPSSNYSERDFETYYARLKDQARKWMVDASGRQLWTDFDSKTPENMILRGMAWMGENFAFMRDTHIGEAMPISMRRRENILKVCRIFGYQIPGPTPASVPVRFSIPAVIAYDVTVEEGTVLMVGALRYVVTADATIPAGQTYVDGSAEQYSEQEENDVGAGLANESVSLGAMNYVDGTMSVVTSQGTWTQAEDNTFLKSGPGDLHFKLYKDARYRPIVSFGDGVNGAVPEGSRTFTYRTTLGTAGRVSVGRLKGTLSVEDDGLNQRTVTYENSQAASSGGTDGERTGETKAKLPAFIRSSDALITKDDYEAYARGFASVGNAYLLTRDDSEAAEVNGANLYIVAKGTTLDSYVLPAAPTQSLLDDVQDGVDEKRIVGFRVTVRTAVFATVHIEATADFSEDYEGDEVADAVWDALQKYFAVLNPDGTHGEVQFGIEYPVDNDDEDYRRFRWSDVFNVVRDTAGIDLLPADLNNLLLNSLHEDVRIRPWEFPLLGTFKIIDRRTGSTYERSD